MFLCSQSNKVRDFSEAIGNKFLSSLLANLYNFHTYRHLKTPSPKVEIWKSGIRVRDYQQVKEIYLSWQFKGGFLFLLISRSIVLWLIVLKLQQKWTYKMIFSPSPVRSQNTLTIPLPKYTVAFAGYEDECIVVVLHREIGRVTTKRQPSLFPP